MELRREKGKGELPGGWGREAGLDVREQHLHSKPQGHQEATERDTHTAGLHTHMHAQTHIHTHAHTRR